MTMFSPGRGCVSGRVFLCRDRDSNPDEASPQRILSPLRLPFRHPGIQLSNSTLRRSSPRRSRHDAAAAACAQFNTIRTSSGPAGSPCLIMRNRSSSCEMS